MPDPQLPPNSDPSSPSPWLLPLLQSPDPERDLRQAWADMGGIPGLQDPLEVWDPDQSQPGWIPRRSRKDPNSAPTRGASGSTA